MAERVDFYTTLNLTRSSTLIDVKRAYKRLALQKHPDMDKGSDTEFVAVGLAYHVLSSNKLKAQYDANELEFHNSRALLVDSFDITKALEIFQAFFGTANPFATVTAGVNELFDAAEADRKPKPAAPIQLSLSCTLVDLYNGVKKTVSVSKKRVSSTGEVDAYTKTYVIAAQPYWIDGTTLVFEKEADDVTGDVIFTVKVEPHETFSIKGFNLHVKHALPLHKALTGVVMSLSMPDGRKLNLSVEEVIHPAFVKVVKGEGLLDKQAGRRGDLVIEFEVVFPKTLAPFQRELCSAALCLDKELLDETNLKRQLLQTALILPPNLAETERKKVQDVVKLTVKRDELPPPE
uniref:J domain-containing protein n=1 Tax=Hemiselmis andersenii TaxID=464988 RepID=A0A6U2F4M2_HEMAN|mmetsp:Transcript_30176/g.70499  ORF Transcript_30176/g.70499 Transcript_30176/m.70499 type:complete len:348 (+) Transcript_30176:97-1140(+)|eukprot:CAMPEP_0114126616 /NCGR_PEP_ID=MMETSP0043_2-20121206/9925_1 /TAXON_ID=464988 /ORGANISM="Hemiselmis andersenii, Strain CCMP644" /LENGTH=347 /DNA_ID=CAMNT_0001219613 /DNA_START=128 /DNA_END=1172 /DNA_ORIENTATION=-